MLFNWITSEELLLFRLYTHGYKWGGQNNATEHNRVQQQTAAPMNDHGVKLDTFPRKAEYFNLRDWGFIVGQFDPVRGFSYNEMSYNDSAFNKISSPHVDLYYYNTVCTYAVMVVT